jgi:uncharacterized membrane protein
MFYEIQQSPMKFRLWSGLIVWILIAFFLTFILHSFPILWWTGFICGFVIYGVYNFTNLATLSHYSFTVSLIDTLWGTFLLGIVSMIGSIIYKKQNNSCQ